LGDVNRVPRRRVLWAPFGLEAPRPERRIGSLSDPPGGSSGVRCCARRSPAWSPRYARSGGVTPQRRASITVLNDELHVTRAVSKPASVNRSIRTFGPACAPSATGPCWASADGVHRSTEPA
jgi:hypothetical protein